MEENVSTLEEAMQTLGEMRTEYPEWIEANVSTLEEVQMKQTV